MDEEEKMEDDDKMEEVDGIETRCTSCLHTDEPLLILGKEDGLKIFHHHSLDSLKGQAWRDTKVHPAM